TEHTALRAPFGAALSKTEPEPELGVEPEVSALIATWWSSEPEFKIRWKRSSESTYTNFNGKWIAGPCEPCSYVITSYFSAPLEYVPFDIEVAKHQYERGPLIGQSEKFMEVTPLVPLVPAVTSVRPAYGPHTGGTTVTISGENLDATATVKFGSVEAQEVNI